MKTSFNGHLKGKVRRAMQVLGAIGLMSASSAHAHVTCRGNIT